MQLTDFLSVSRGHLGFESLPSGGKLNLISSRMCVKVGYAKPPTFVGGSIIIVL